MTDGEKNLLAGCLRGEKIAWDTFVLQYSSLVYHTIRKTFSQYRAEASADRVEDLFQEFFVSLLRDDLRKLRQFRGDRDCSLASWLRVMATRLTIDSLRKQKTCNVEAAESFFSNSSDPSKSLLDEGLHESLSLAMQTLSARERLLLDLHYLQALPPEEVASILKISVGAFYTQKSRILAKLRETIRKTGCL